MVLEQDTVRCNFLSSVDALIMGYVWIWHMRLRYSLQLKFSIEIYIDCNGISDNRNCSKHPQQQIHTLNILHTSRHHFPIIPKKLIPNK